MVVLPFASSLKLRIRDVLAVERSGSAAMQMSDFQTRMLWYALIRDAYTTVGIGRLIVAALSTIWIAPILIVARVLLLVGRHVAISVVLCFAGGRRENGFLCLC